MATNKRIEKLYGGDVEITFYPDSHRYKKSNEKTYLISSTGVTGVIDKSRFLIPWAVNLASSFLKDYIENSKAKHFTAEELLPLIDEAAKQHTVKKEEAGDVGSLVHGWLEAFAVHKMTGSELPPLPENEKAVNGIGAFLDWYNSNEVEFLHAERLLYSRRHDYVGITDLIAVVNGKKVVGDWKTSKGVYDDFFLQLSGYWGAAEEEDGTQFDEGLILHFDKETGAFEVHTMSREEHNENLEIFLALLKVKRWQKKKAGN